MAQQLKRVAPDGLRDKRRAAASRYFSMTPAELDKLLQDPKEARRALIFMLGVMKLLLVANQTSPPK
jgi:hypothetical protein